MIACKNATRLARKKTAHGERGGLRLTEIAQAPAWARTFWKLRFPCRIPFRCRARFERDNTRGEGGVTAILGLGANRGTSARGAGRRVDYRVFVDLRCLLYDLEVDVPELASR